MEGFRQSFNPRQYMVTPDFELFHYSDENNMEIDYHNHDFYEIYFYLSGRVTYMIEGKSYKLRAGDIILINNRELHKPLIESGEIYERIVIWVKPGFLVKQSTEESNLSMAFESSSQSKYNLLRPDSEMRLSIMKTLDKFEKTCISTAFGSSILQKGYLTELLVLLNRAFQEGSGKHIEIDIEYNEKINKIIKYINDNLGAQLTLDFLARRFYLSKYHLLREFKKNVGYSIHQYIQRKRLMMARVLLREGGAVTDVSMRCGFGDYSNFIRSFKKEFGISPKKYGRMNG